MVRLLLNGTTVFHFIVNIVLDFTLMFELHIYFVGLISGPLMQFSRLSLFEIHLDFDLWTHRG
jgi:hypothetical protein